MTEEKNIERVEELTRLKGSVFEIKPYKKMKIGIITTGNEVFNGLIEDKFGEIIKDKMKYYEAEVVGHTICPDNINAILQAIVEFIDKGEHEFHIKFGGDILVFFMHTNVFDFEKSHPIWKTLLIRPVTVVYSQIGLEDPLRFAISSQLNSSEPVEPLFPPTLIG